MHRNPSPPPAEAECIPVGDVIGDTVYSKHWVLHLVMNLLQYTQSRAALVVAHVQQQPVDSGPEEMEMDDEWEQELCKLWDASVDEVCISFLFNFCLVIIYCYLFSYLTLTGRFW